MFFLILGILIRIFSNSYLNVIQKFLTNKGEKSSVVNFYTYLGLTILILPFYNKIIYNSNLLFYIINMGLLGGLGNYYIIKSLSCGDLSAIAPINAYKPIVALCFGIILLKEFPTYTDFFGMIFIIIGSILLANSKLLFNKSTFYRFIALILSGTEAIFIKKIIILTDVPSTFFYWAISGLIFTLLFTIISKNKFKISKNNFKYQIGLILMVAIMQYSTNYVFSKINVSYALALFQLSTILSIFLGVNIFKETNFLRKIYASILMLIGAVIIIIT